MIPEAQPPFSCLTGILQHPADCLRASASHSTPPSKTVLCAVSDPLYNGSNGEQAASIFEKSARVPLVVSQKVYWVGMIEGELPTAPGVFCLAPPNKATHIQSLQAEQSSTRDPWADLWLSRILLSLLRKF